MLGIVLGVFFGGGSQPWFWNDLGFIIVVLLNFVWMIFGWIFDAASQRRWKMLENVNMLKTMRLPTNSTISMLDALTIFWCVLWFSMQNGAQKSSGFRDRFLAPKIDEKWTKQIETSILNQSKNYINVNHFYIISHDKGHCVFFLDDE